MDSKPAPYPADTLAKGWRFELDHERIEQSDTWALASPELRPWLLMLWMMSWRQTPCGTLPNNDAVIAARIGMPLRTFTKHRDVLMRGWWIADDGRQYHDTITGRVRAMLDKRASDAQRAANRRGRKADAQGDSPGGNGGSPPGQLPELPPESRVTPSGVPPEFDTKHQAVKTIPRTDTQPGVSGDNFPDPSPYGAAFGLLHRLGVIGASPGDPEFRAMVDKGVSDDEWRTAVDKAAGKQRRDLPFIVGIIRNQRLDAAAVSEGLPARQAMGGVVTVAAAETTEQYLARTAAERAEAQARPKASPDAVAKAELVKRAIKARSLSKGLPA
jgi:hypothetical protein